MSSLAALLDDFEDKSQTANQRTYHFEAEIQKMMFACGDSSKPSLESAHLIERIVHQQLVSLLLQAQEVAEMREAKYIRTEDILFLLRKDKMKLRRAVKFLCFSDTRHTLYTDMVGAVEKRMSLGGKRRQLCKEFLMTIDGTGQLLSWIDDETIVDSVKAERMQRADQMASTMDTEEYLAFAHARGQSFTHSSNTNSVKLRAWLLSDTNFLADTNRPQLPLGHGIHMEILGYVAHETLAQIIDFALLVRRDATALSTDPMNRLMPPSLFTPAVVPSIRTSTPGEPKPRSLKLEGTSPLSQHEIREAVRRYWSPISPFSTFSRNIHPPMDRQLFCK